MIVCKKCGTHNPDDGQWCVSCESFLEWDGEKVAAPAAPQVVEQAPITPTEPRRGLIKRIKAAVGMDDPEKGSPRNPA